MISESKTPEVVESSDLPICAFVIARHSATLLSHSISHEGKVFFRLSLPLSGKSFAELKDSFEKHATVSGLTYSKSLHELKKLVISARRASGVAL